MAIEAISSDASASAAHTPSAGLLKDAPVDALALTMRFLSYAEAMRAGSSCSDLREAYYKNSLIHVTTDVVGGKPVAIDLDVGSAKQVVLLSIIRSGLFGRTDLSRIIEAHSTDMVVREHFEDWSWSWEALAKIQWPSCDKVFPRHAKSGRYDLLYDGKDGQDWFQRLAEAEEPREEVERDIIFFQNIKDGEDPVNTLVGLQRLHLTFEMDWGRWGHVLASAVAASGIVNRIGRLLPSDDNTFREEKGNLAPGTGEAACRIFEHLCENGSSSVVSAMVEEGSLHPLVCALGSFSIGDYERDICARCLQTIALTSVEMSNAIIEARAFSSLRSLVFSSYHTLRVNSGTEFRGDGGIDSEEQKRILVSTTKCMSTLLDGIRRDQSIHPLLSKELVVETVPTLKLLVKNSLPSSIVEKSLDCLGTIASMAVTTLNNNDGDKSGPAQIVKKIAEKKMLRRLARLLRSTSEDIAGYGLNLMYVLAQGGQAQSIVSAGFLGSVSNILQLDHWFPDDLFAALMSSLASTCDDLAPDDESFLEYSEFIWPGVSEIFVEVPLRQLFVGDSWLYNLATQSSMIQSKIWLEQFARRLKTKNRKQKKVMKSLGELQQLFRTKGATQEASALARGVVASGGLSQIGRLLQQTDSAEARTSMAAITFSIVTLSRSGPSFVSEELIDSKIMQSLWSTLVSRSSNTDIIFWWFACVDFFLDRSDIFDFSVIQYLIRLAKSQNGCKPSCTPNNFLPLPMSIDQSCAKLGDVALYVTRRYIKSFCTSHCFEKLSIVVWSMQSLFFEPCISDSVFSELMHCVAMLPTAIEAALNTVLFLNGATSRLVKCMKSFEPSYVRDYILLPLLSRALFGVPGQNSHGSGHFIQDAFRAGLASIDFGHLLEHPSIYVVDQGCMLIGGAFTAVNLLDSEDRLLLLENREILIKNLSFQDDLAFPDSYESWSRRYVSAGALSLLAYGLVQGPEFDRRESKSLVNNLIDEGVVASLCSALGQFDEPENEGRCFSSSHFLSGIHGVLQAGTFEKSDNVTSDFIGAVARYAPEISALQQSTNEQCRYWSKRIVSEFFPEETSS